MNFDFTFLQLFVYLPILLDQKMTPCCYKLDKRNVNDVSREYFVHVPKPEKLSLFFNNS